MMYSSVPDFFQPCLPSGEGRIVIELMIDREDLVDKHASALLKILVYGNFAKHTLEGMFQNLYMYTM